MRYPKVGGYKSFIQSLIDEANIELNKRAVRIDQICHRIYLENGEIISYDKLVSTLPLPILVGMMEDVPENVSKSANSLEATSIDLISVGFNVALDLDLWFYIYDEDIYASRAYSPSKKSTNNVPEGCSSLQFEIYQRGRKAKYSPEQLKENVLYAIKKMKIAKDNEIVFMHHKRLDWGNVIFDVGMEENREVIREYLVKGDVRSCGRFGEWDYLWSNQSFISGYKVI